MESCIGALLPILEQNIGSGTASNTPSTKLPTPSAASLGLFRSVYIHVVWFTLWVAINLGAFGQARQFDPFPFGLLTMIVSLEAIFLSTFILITQNRQEVQSELRAEFDFRNNVRGEIWAAHIGQALGLDADHVEDIVRQTVESYVMEAEAQAQ